MTETDTIVDDEVGGAPAEATRHLSSTIVALRHALEEREVGHNLDVQKVRAEYESRITEFEATIAALRGALEQVRHNGQAEVEHAVASSAGEIGQLRQTIQALRDTIERLHHDHAHEIQSLNATAQDEAAQLQAAARKLRQRLEETSFQALAEKQEAVATAAVEIQELKTTCQALRKELDRLRDRSMRPLHYLGMAGVAPRDDQRLSRRASALAVRASAFKTSAFCSMSPGEYRAVIRLARYSRRWWK